jgi:hypothetical protein
MLFEIDGNGGAVAFFRKKLVGMARRTVRILQRSFRDLVPRCFFPLIQDSLPRLPSLLSISQILGNM